MDFSAYNGPSEEWLKVQETLPAWTFDISVPPVKLRETVNGGREQLAATNFANISSRLVTTDYTIPTRDGSQIEARSYRPISKPKDEELPVYLYFHGGGFIFGSVASEDALCGQLALNLDIIVLNVNYRHTPEHPFPDAWHDAQDAYAWLHDNMSTVGGDVTKIVVGGISAGGQLTASLTLEQNLGKALTNYPKPAGQILMIPCLAHLETYADGPAKKLKDPSLSSYVANENAPLLPKNVIEFFSDLLKSGTPDPKDTKLNIVGAESEDVKGLPPTVFGICGLDPLRDEALFYAKTVSEARVPTHTTLIKGVPHGFRRWASDIKAGKDWDDVVENGIRWVLEKPKATGNFDIIVKG
ncbi:alpha/beta hydrolase fold-3 domain-containing protein [Corynespora cassiicola Philippines]|uniref:Alpha/beta hydrolase fold-3 domain-containing protein n=1 Tax=Corynespora cassiicola Philippines TaxID=1448308 RepID=A0A2T2N442_CORCC|nr:alpha/beta hydrolase fold-3 domain-containing protein [Corynespora cassiicola Philippines]